MNYSYNFPQRATTSNNIKQSGSRRWAAEGPCHERLCSDATSRTAPELISPLTEFLLQVRRYRPYSSATSAVVYLTLVCRNLAYGGGQILRRGPSVRKCNKKCQRGADDGVRQLVPVRPVCYESVYEGKHDDSLVSPR